MLFSCSSTPLCPHYEIVSVQNPGNWETFSVKYTTPDCDDCTVSSFEVEASRYEEYLDRLGEIGCLEDLL